MNYNAMMTTLLLQVICPTAPMLPVTLNGGMSMPAWYDIRSLDEADKDGDGSINYEEFYSMMTSAGRSVTCSHFITGY